MEKTEIAKATMTAGIVLSVIGAVAGTPVGNALSGAGLIIMALSILLFPDALVDIIYEYMMFSEHTGDDHGVPDREEGSSDR